MYLYFIYVCICPLSVLWAELREINILIDWGTGIKGLMRGMEWQPSPKVTMSY